MPLLYEGGELSLDWRWVWTLELETAIDLRTEVKRDKSGNTEAIIQTVIVVWGSSTAQKRTRPDKRKVQLEVDSLKLEA